MTLLVSAGVRSTPGVLIVPFELSFGWTHAEVTFPLAINIALYGLCGPFAAAFMERYGVKRMMLIALSLLAIGTGLSVWMKTTWQMTLLWGFLVGTGAGLTSSVLGAIIANRWFKEKRGLVVGVFSASGVAGQLVFLPLFAQMISFYGWQTVVLVTSLSALITMLLVGLFMRDKPSDVGLLPYGATEPVETAAAPHANPFLSALNGLKIGVRSKDFYIYCRGYPLCNSSRVCSSNT
ncbi:MFS transporter [Parageobacillus toebii]|uniref:MFS transporter n=1 Tax=Parageobacillus toebii TaxID=153151 RepID=UPI002E22C842|nr:MFS transporter [Parageobacillus toebii]MED4969375.1 MFS transporter [Parageobacillus toebii]